MQGSQAAGVGPQRLSVAGRICLGLIAVGCLIRLLGLAQRPLWDDEAFTYFVSHRGVLGLLGVLHYDAQPPLFYMIEALFLQLLGPSELALRLPSLLAGLGLVAAVVRIGTRHWDREIGLLAGALVATCPLLIYQSFEARSYSLLALLLLSAAWNYHQHSLQPCWKSGVSAAVLGTLALYTHYFGVFILLFGALTLLGKPWRRLPVLVAPLLVNGLGFVAMLPLLRQQQLRHGGKQFHPEGSLIGTVVRSFLVTGTGAFPEGAVKVGAALAFFALLLGATYGLWKARERWAGAVFPLLLAGLLFVLLHVGLVMGRWPVRDSYLSLLTAPFLLLLAAGLGQAKGSRLGMLPAGLAILVMATGDLWLVRGRAHANPDYRWAAREVSRRRPEGVVLTRPWGDLACYAFYTPQWGNTAVFAVDPHGEMTEEALVVERPLRGADELIERSSRICVLGKTSGVSGFEALDNSLRKAGYSCRETLRRGDIRLETWERPKSALVR